ncbi:hypothetical protein SpiGrapes_3094 [Sphaerochaeta pleomorpha str. Grapes]|uniref:Uncharacterized protein n=1 Tax=Sphaerochaeta pleomorpha (strain ATCC BAA-1885 / DSM 22778 / Grapes) TaxID=158190 RepID=G8QYY2_SPHPG|nr:hypothetical protein SpiGrapes_3094 [Sphaerochaeta pleomorpha str. Grapes]
MDAASYVSLSFFSLLSYNPVYLSVGYKDKAPPKRFLPGVGLFQTLQFQVPSVYNKANKRYQKTNFACRYRVAITSISTIAPFASLVTSTQARAGGSIPS